jgi:uncharacterized caspase-like protein
MSRGMNDGFWCRPYAYRRLTITRFVLTLVAVFCVSWGTPADAKKMALIIGNSIYSNTSALTNPANDAQIIATAARAAGFEVTMASDLTMANFQRTLRDFRVAAEGADVAMIYYAGHGIEGQGKNWLIPVDSKLETQFDLPYEAINMDRLLEALAGARVRMIVLDACRNNPFGNAWKSGIRAVPMGLNGAEYDDVLVIFAAAPGQTATDGTGVNSPFAVSVAKRLPEPGLPIQMLGGAVRDDVLAATGGNQRPFVSASITGTPIYLVPAPRTVPVQAAVAPPATVSSGSGGDRSMLDALMWQGAASSNTLAGYQAYLREFPAGIFSNVARESIAKLQVGTLPITSAAPQITRAPETATPSPAMVSPPITTTNVGTGNVSPVVQQPASAPYVQTAINNLPAPGSQSGLPVLPPTPRFSAVGYPTCRENFQSLIGTIEKVDAINSCTVTLDKYYNGVLIPFRQAMIDHQKRITAMYTEQVGGQMKFLAESKSQFYQAMMKEFAESNPEGVHFGDHRASEARYKEDRAYLQDRYCFNTGCKGYPVPAYVQPASPVAPPKK